MIKELNMRHTLIKVFFLVTAFCWGSAYAKFQQSALLPISVDELRTIHVPNGVIRLVQHYAFLSNYLPPEVSLPMVLKLEFWNTERNQLYTRIELEKEIVVDGESFEIQDMPDVVIESFEVNNQQVTIMLKMIILRSSTVNAQCTAPIFSKSLGPLTCTGIGEKP